MDILIGVIIGFGAAFAVAFILTTLRNRSETEAFWRMLRALDDRIDELEEDRQNLRDRLAAQIWRNRRLSRQSSSAPDDEALWRVGEIERQITAWEKL